MAILFAPPRFKATDKDNAPIPGAFLQFYATQTSTPQPIWADVLLTIPLPNPVQADANGLFTAIWLDDSLPAYKYVLTSPNVNDPTVPGSIIYTGDPYNSILPANALADQILPFLNPISAAEIAAGVTPVNYSYAPGDVLRYGTNTNPGTTDMGPALNSAIQVALASGSSVRFAAGAYSIATKPVFGAVTANIIPLDIGGAGTATQLINNLTAGTSALFPMAGKNGWYIHDLLICGNSVHKNTGIEINTSGGPESIEWLIERVTDLSAGIGIKMADTNTGTIRNYRHWPGNNPTLIVPQTVSNADISHGIYLTGGFCHNISMYDLVCPPNSNYNADMCGIKCDASAADGCLIAMPLVQTGSGSNNETGIDWNVAGSTNDLEIISAYHEGTIISLGSVGQSRISCTDGGGGGTLLINPGSRQNTFMGNVATLTIADSSCYGNTFINFSARNGFTDATEGNNLLSQPNRFIGCNLWNGSAQMVVANLGQKWLTLLSYAATMNLDTYAGNTQVVRVTDGAALAFNVPLHPRNGQEIEVILRNETGGAMGAVTWGGVSVPASVPLPAAGFQRKYVIQRDSIFPGWHMVLWSPADVAN